MCFICKINVHCFLAGGAALTTRSIISRLRAYGGRYVVQQQEWSAIIMPPHSGHTPAAAAPVHLFPGAVDQPYSLLQQHAVCPELL